VRGANDVLKSGPPEGAISGETKQLAVIRAIAEIEEAVAQEEDLDSILHRITRNACELIEIERCSVWLREVDSDLFRGHLAHSTPNIDQELKHYIAGTDADMFTREILSTKRPVVIANTAADPRPIRSTMRAWKIRSMLGVPMVREGEVTGLLFLDNADASHPFDPSQVAVAEMFGNLAAIAIGQAQLQRKLKTSYAAAARANTILRRVLSTEGRLTQLLIDGADLSQIAATAAEVADRPCVVKDHCDRILAFAVPPGADPELPAEFSDAVSGTYWARRGNEASDDAGIVGPLPAEGLRRRVLIEPVQLVDEVAGTFALLEDGSPFSALDTMIARRGAVHVALELTAAKREANAQWDAGESLARSLVRGNRDRDSLHRRASFLGFNLETPRALCLIRPHSAETAGTDLTARAVAEAMEAVQPDSRVLAFGVPDGIVAILEAPPETRGPAAASSLKPTVRQALEKLDSAAGSAVGISTTCRRAEDYPRAHEEVQQVSDCLALFTPGIGISVLAADDLGAAKLLLASIDRETAHRFADDTLGPLLTDPAQENLLGTVYRFFANDRNIRRTAAALEVHENTVRYRVQKVEQVTGLAISHDAAAQLTLQIALLVVQLEGRLASVAPPAWAATAP
jgi:sugar diacid utilization regulator